MPVRINSICASILEEIASNSELKREVLIKRQFDGDYEKQESDSFQGFSYHLPKTQEEICATFYRGEEKAECKDAEDVNKKNVHVFYFVPCLKILKMSNRELRGVAKKLRGNDKMPLLEPYAPKESLFGGLVIRDDRRKPTHP